MFLKILLPLTVSTFAFAATQEIGFQKGSLNIEGKFPFDASHPLNVSGYDKAGNAYKLEVVPKMQAKNIYQVTYHLIYLGEKSSGSISIEQGKMGEVATEVQGKVESKLTITIKK